MARTTTRDIIKVCADLARMDRKAKIEIMQYLSNDLATTIPEPKKKPASYPEGGEQ